MSDPLRRRQILAGTAALSLVALPGRVARASDQVLLIDPPPSPWTALPVVSTGERRGYLIAGAAFRPSGPFAVSLDLAPWPETLGPAQNLRYVLALYGLTEGSSVGLEYAWVTAGVQYQSPLIPQPPGGGRQLDHVLVPASKQPGRSCLVVLYLWPGTAEGAGFSPCYVENQSAEAIDFRAATIGFTRQILHRVTLSPQNRPMPPARPAGPAVARP